MNHNFASLFLGFESVACGLLLLCSYHLVKIRKIENFTFCLSVYARMFFDVTD